MIKRFVQRWEQRKEYAEAAFAATHPEGYADVVRVVVEALNDTDDGWWPDPNRIAEIDHGDYQGTVMYVIGERGYHPHVYWAVAVGYGSCSGCDTLQSIQALRFDADQPTPEQVKQYMMLALDIVRGLRQISGYVWDETTEGA